MSRKSGLVAFPAPAVLMLLCAGCVPDSPVRQPIMFSHRQHVEKQIRCTFCHSGSERYSTADLPGVTLCMSCHSAIKADSPEIMKVKEYLDRKEEIPWRRLYHLPEQADVFFNHRRHAAAGVGCSACHGDVSTQDVLSPQVDLTMGFCVSCHRLNSTKFRLPALADDCATCHR
jgi:hypothetical protein